MRKEKYKKMLVAQMNTSVLNFSENMTCGFGIGLSNGFVPTSKRKSIFVPIDEHHLIDSATGIVWP